MFRSSIPNMEATFSNCLIKLEKGVIFNDSIVIDTIIDSNVEHQGRESITLRGQNDNLRFVNCYLYCEEPWENIKQRSKEIKDIHNHIR